MPVCFTCTRLIEFPYCAAFQEAEIPDEIASNADDHTLPFPGDHGLRYKHGEPSGDDTPEED
jgi:hypothetical protein